MAEAEAHRLVQIAVSKIKREDIVHRGFLKPIEIALKTYNSELLEEDTKLKPGCLASGLKIAVKACPDSDIHFLQNIEEITENQAYCEIKENNQDNMLALMKSQEGIELAICVCMYSEDKKMLKSTLAGVAENISNMVAIGGLDPDKIGVFVMMDGIQKVDNSIVDYFEELERSSNINLGNNIAPSLSVPELAKRTSTMSEQLINEQEMKNVNNFLFDVAELEERNRMRFQSVKLDYNEKKKLLDVIHELKKGKPLYQDLPNSLHRFFLAAAKKQRRTDYNETEEEVNLIKSEDILEEYASDVRRMRPLIGATINAAEEYCTSYLLEKEDLAYLAYFRRKVKFSFKHITQSNYNTAEHQNDVLNEEIEHPQPQTVMNLFLCIKYKNSGKLSSHNWFFNGFCRELKPKFAILLDVGLKPDGEALLKMYDYMKNRPTVGGVCGYMSLKIEKTDESQQIKDQDVDCLTSVCNKFVDIQRTQQVEYHFAHLMDKPFEAAFGFIHVLPGAFSAYNMEAIMKYDDEEDDELLKAYFKSIDQKMAERKVINAPINARNAILRTLFPDFLNSCCIAVNPESDEAMLYDENVYLAEDRILCMGIHKRGFEMAFLPDAYANVDPIKTVHGLLGQRKRWINGSYFAFEKVKRQLAQHQRYNGYECLLHIQLVYLTLMNSLTYFAPTFFLFTVHIAMEAFRDDVLVKLLAGVISNPNTSEFYNAFVYTIDFIYVMLIGSIIFFSLNLTNSNKAFKPYIYAVSTIFGLFMFCVFGVLTVDVIRGLISNETFLVQNQAVVGDIPGGINTINIMRWVLVGSIVIYIFPLFTYIFLFSGLNILCEIILGSLSFLFYGPTYLIILNVYSLCRIDDISWGTKGLDNSSAKNANLKDSWKVIKFVHVSKYVIWNVIFSTVLLTLGGSYVPRFFVTFAIMVIIGVTMSVKVIVGLIYLLAYWCRTVSFSKKTPVLNTESRIDKLIESYQPEIMQEVRDNLNNIKQEYMSNAYLGSFIQAARNRSSIERSYSKQRQIMFKKSGSMERRFSISRKFSKEPPSPMSAKPMFNSRSEKNKVDIFPNNHSNPRPDQFLPIREEERSDKNLVHRPDVNAYNLETRPGQGLPQGRPEPQNQSRPQGLLYSQFHPQNSAVQGQSRGPGAIQPQPRGPGASQAQPQNPLLSLFQGQFQDNSQPSNSASRERPFPQNSSSRVIFNNGKK